jgi:hypothetical protein
MGNPHSRSRVAQKLLRTRLLGELVACVAGPIAEARYGRRSAVLDPTPGGDAHHAQSLATALCSDAAKAGILFASAVVTARSVIYSHWDDVTRLAKALIENGTLSGQDVRAMVLRQQITEKGSGRKAHMVLMQNGRVLGRSQSFCV